MNRIMFVAGIMILIASALLFVLTRESVDHITVNKVLAL
jgi:hypothetical protein